MAAGRFVIVLLLFTISNLALIELGWQYDDIGGGPIEKLHPASWLAIALFAVHLFKWGNPLTGLIAIFDRHRDLVPFLAGIVFMIIYCAVVLKAPFTIFLETFLAPLMIFLLFEGISDQEGKRLSWLIHFLMMCNAILGIYEFITAYHLTPLVVNGEVLVDEVRSTALLGHPLANAAIAGSYVLMLVLGGRHNLPGILALILFTLNLGSMFVFGGRAATVLVGAGLVLIGIQRLVGIVRGNKIRIHTLRTALIATPVYCLLIAALSEYGFFDAFTERIVDDEGSAGTRVTMFSIFDHVKWSDLIFAPDAKEIGTWASIYGLDYGIENFIVAFILSFGILATIVFLPALLLFCGAVVRALRPKTLWVFAYFFAVAMTSVSLASKSPLLSTILVAMMVLMRRKAGPDLAASAAPRQRGAIPANASASAR